MEVSEGMKEHQLKRGFPIADNQKLNQDFKHGISPFAPLYAFSTNGTENIIELLETSG